ncbi:protein phosphatase 2C domain-containing protein [Larkinella punicea]|uniref:protein phosphatase 2C domain-containing protein n=1 Tax=Larkinella punicea TaxID=2315727 RepID=UPI001403B70F|nr:protein phosphatase 2C domain-containing protein [Larkinella punicea]
MKLTIHQPLGYSSQGGRSNNEDTIFPGADDATPFQPWFMVCDGVGGAARGEIASHIATEGFNDYFIQNPEPVATPVYVQSALDYVQTRFDEYLARHPEAHGMATTLTLVFFHEAGATVAHLGDSRVYHLRDGKVIWRTEDHSLVNQLLRAGVITREEAREHPQRNVIERAIQGSSKTVKADVQLLNDVRPGDYFFLCTDGVLERVSDELLENVLGSDASNEQKKQTLIDCCTGKTKDNFSAYLIQIETVQGEVADEYRVPQPTFSLPETVPDETIAVVAVDAKRTTPSQEHDPVRPEPKRYTAPRHAPEEPVKNAKLRTDLHSLFPLLTIALLAVLLTLGGVYAFRQWRQPDTTETVVTEPENRSEQPPGSPQKTTGLPSPTKPKPAPDPTPGAEAVQGITTQAFGDGDPYILITDDLFRKKTGSGWVLVDKKGHQKNKNVYDEVREPRENFIAVRKKGKWGYVTATGIPAIYCQFDRAGDFEDGQARVMEKGEEFYIDKTGKRFL